MLRNLSALIISMTVAIASMPTAIARALCRARVASTRVTRAFTTFRFAIQYIATYFLVIDIVRKAFIVQNQHSAPIGHILLTPPLIGGYELRCTKPPNSQGFSWSPSNTYLNRSKLASTRLCNNHIITMHLLFCTPLTPRLHFLAMCPGEEASF